MKKLTAITIAMFFVTFGFAQKMHAKNIPENVRLSFQKKYPTIKNAKWDREGDKYEASFDLNEKENAVLIDAKGNVLETEIEVELKQLPKSIIDYIKANYAERKAKGGAKITDAKGVITYEVEIKGMDLIFDSNGIFIKELKG